MDAKYQELLALSLANTVTERGTSYYAEYARCSYAGYLRYERHLEPVGEKPTALRIGSLCHSGLAFAGHLAMSGFNVSSSDMDALLEAADESEPIKGEADQILRRYFGEWGFANAGYPRGVILKEIEVSKETVLDGGPFFPPRRFTTRLDALVEEGGELVVYNHKTASYPPPDGAAELWAVRPQHLIEAYLADVNKVVLNILPKRAPSKTAEKPFIPQRMMLNISTEKIGAFLDSPEAKVLSSSLITPRQNFYACSPPLGDPCPFFKWCHGTSEERRCLYQTKEGAKENV